MFGNDAFDASNRRHTAPRLQTPDAVQVPSRSLGNSWAATRPQIHTGLYRKLWHRVKLATRDGGLPLIIAPMM
jgi:hypothetical protein